MSVTSCLVAVESEIETFYPCGSAGMSRDRVETRLPPPVPHTAHPLPITSHPCSPSQPPSLPPSASAPLLPRGPHIRTPHNLGASQVPPVHAQKWRHLWVLLGLGGERCAGGCGRYRALRERHWGHGAGWGRPMRGHSPTDFNLGWTARGGGLG